MGLLYKREEFDFQFLPYVFFFGIYTQDGHIQIRKTEFAPCVLNQSHRILSLICQMFTALTLQFFYVRALSVLNNQLKIFGESAIRFNS